MLKKLIIAGMVIGLVVLTTWQLLSNSKEAKGKIYRRDPNARTIVKTAKIGYKDITDGRQFLGTFEPNREIQVLAEANGKIVLVSVKDGDFVGAGTLIAKIDDEMLQYQLMAAEASWQSAVSDRQHYENLVADDAIPKMQLDKAILAEKVAEAQLKQLQKQLKNTQIISPFAGVITAKMFDLGSVVGMGTPLVRLTDIGLLKLTVNVSEKDVFKFVIGQIVKIQTDVHPGVNLAGTVLSVGNKSDMARNYPVQILVQNSGNFPLKAGMNGTVVMQENIKTRALVVPRQALLSSAKQPQVYVASDGKAILKNLVLGAATNDDFEIVEGLQEGEEVIVSGQINLENGAAIDVQPIK
ncbi:MAG TPA: efflux transporter periplasmic adaptor subunit [Microscillaceae bacterium]|jgi:RND family efflux transporter MFP subunit|nr:efflux transporter periplasmic adaptor subunit [Microscillaceae bacterium]